MFKKPYLSQHKRHTTIKPRKIQKLFRPLIPNESLTHPLEGFWSIFFTKLSGYHINTQQSRLDQSKMILGPFEQIRFFGPDPLLQDIITRWWSSYRMLKCLRFLKPALMCLYAAKEITCDMLDYDQWVVLEQIAITLKKIAMWQRILEGEKYPTGLLVVSAMQFVCTMLTFSTVLMLKSL